MRSMLPFDLLVYWSFLPLAASLRLHSISDNSGAKHGANHRIMTIVMRKQKASDKRTTRLQKGLEFEHLSSFAAISTSKGTTPFPQISGVVTSSPMTTATWDYKSIDLTSVTALKESAGRGRARKRAQLYSGLAAYHTEFMSLLTEEYRAEVSFCFCRLLEGVF